MTNKTAYELLHNIECFPEFCENYLYIQPTWGGELIPLRLNPIQRYVFYTYILPTFKAGLPLRLVVLKMRQSGISTLVEAFCFWMALGNKHRRSVIVADKEHRAKTIFTMMKRFKQNLPSPAACRKAGIPELPEFIVCRDAAGVLELNEALPKFKKTKPNQIVMDNIIEVKTAQDKDALGRAGTYQFVHASECAYWPNLLQSMGSLLSCCHDNPYTVVVLETTAHGYNEFYDFWTNSQVGEIDVPQTWQQVFIPWYWDCRYELDFKADHATIDDYEDTLLEWIRNDDTLKRIDPSLTENRIWKKLFWRRSVVRNKFFGDIEHFKQEFPAAAHEAFRSSGRSIFSVAGLARLKKTMTEPPWTGEVRLERDPKDDSEVRVPKVIKMDEMDRGRLKIWIPAEPNCLYVIGADIAAGKKAAGIVKEGKRDFSCAQIFKASCYPPLEQVAVWHGRMDPDLYGYALVALARHYNNALLAWEVRGPGISLLDKIYRKCRYKNVYKRKAIDSLTEKKVWKVGWDTNTKTKELMVSLGISYVRQGELIIRDEDTIGEMESYVELGERKYGALRGHDDRVMAMLVALAAVDPQIMIIKRKAERMKVEDQASASWSPVVDDIDEEEYIDPILGSEV